MKTTDYAPEDGDSSTQRDQLLRWHGDVNPTTTRPWLIKNLIPETGTGLISGQWGTFKTFVAIDLAVAVMSGQPFIGFPVKRRGGVLFIAAEGQQEVAIRLQAAVEAKCGPAKDQHAPFAWSETCPRLLDKSANRELAAMAKEAADGLQARFALPLALIVIDTIGRSAGYEQSGDENDAATGFKIMRVMSTLSARTGAFVLGVDHFGKAVETGTRGTSSKEGDVDVVLALLGDKTSGGTVTDTRLCARKRRSGANGEEFPFRVKTVDHHPHGRLDRSRRKQEQSAEPGRRLVEVAAPAAADAHEHPGRLRQRAETLPRRPGRARRRPRAGADRVLQEPPRRGRRQDQEGDAATSLQPSRQRRTAEGIDRSARGRNHHLRLAGPCPHAKRIPLEP